MVTTKQTIQLISLWLACTVQSTDTDATVRIGPGGLACAADRTIIIQTAYLGLYSTGLITVTSPLAWSTGSAWSSSSNQDETITTSTISASRPHPSTSVPNIVLPPANQGTYTIPINLSGSTSSVSTDTAGHETTNAVAKPHLLLGHGMPSGKVSDIPANSPFLLGFAYSTQNVQTRQRRQLASSEIPAIGYVQAQNSDHNVSDDCAPGVHYFLDNHVLTGEEGGVVFKAWDEDYASLTPSTPVERVNYVSITLNDGLVTIANTSSGEADIYRCDSGSLYISWARLPGNCSRVVVGGIDAAACPIDSSSGNGQSSTNVKSVVTDTSLSYITSSSTTSTATTSRYITGQQTSKDLSSTTSLSSFSLLDESSSDAASRYSTAISSTTITYTQHTTNTLGAASSTTSTSMLLGTLTDTTVVTSVSALGSTTSTTTSTTAIATTLSITSGSQTTSEVLSTSTLIVTSVSLDELLATTSSTTFSATTTTLITTTSETTTSSSSITTTSPSSTTSSSITTSISSTTSSTSTTSSSTTSSSTTSSSTTSITSPSIYLSTSSTTATSTTTTSTTSTISSTTSTSTTSTSTTSTSTTSTSTTSTSTTSTSTTSTSTTSTSTTSTSTTSTSTTSTSTTSTSTTSTSTTLPPTTSSSTTTSSITTVASTTSGLPTNIALRSYSGSVAATYPVPVSNSAYCPVYDNQIVSYSKQDVGTLYYQAYCDAEIGGEDAGYPPHCPASSAFSMDTCIRICSVWNNMNDGYCQAVVYLGPGQCFPKKNIYKQTDEPQGHGRQYNYYFQGRIAAQLLNVVYPNPTDTKALPPGTTTTSTSTSFISSSTTPSIASSITTTTSSIGYKPTNPAELEFDAAATLPLRDPSSCDTNVVADNYADSPPYGYHLFIDADIGGFDIAGAPAGYNTDSRTGMNECLHRCSAWNHAVNGYCQAAVYVESTDSCYLKYNLYLQLNDHGQGTQFVYYFAGRTAAHLLDSTYPAATETSPTTSFTTSSTPSAQDSSGSSSGSNNNSVDSKDSNNSGDSDGETGTGAGTGTGTSSNSGSGGNSQPNGDSVDSKDSNNSGDGNGELETGTGTGTGPNSGSGNSDSGIGGGSNAAGNDGGGTSENGPNNENSGSGSTNSDGGSSSSSSSESGSGSGSGAQSDSNFGKRSWLETGEDDSDDDLGTLMRRTSVKPNLTYDA